MCQREILSRGKETGEGERPTNLSNRVAIPICPRPSLDQKSETRTRFPPIKAKTPAIVPNQASSRHLLKMLRHPKNRPLPGSADWQSAVSPVGNRPGGAFLDASSDPHPSPWHAFAISPRQSRQKPQQSRLIVPNQGKRKKQTPSRAPTARPHTSPGQRPGFGPRTPPALKGRPNSPIKAKNPTIVHHQGKSRQTPFFQTAIHSANPPAGWGAPALDVGRSMLVVGCSPSPGFPLCNSAPARLCVEPNSLKNRLANPAILW